MQLLSDEGIHKLIKAFSDAQISYDRATRDLILRGIPRDFVDQLSNFPSNKSQLLGDLNTLNSIEELADGSVPLRTLLKNAEAVFASRVEAQVFRESLNILDAARASKKETSQEDKEFKNGGGKSNGSYVKDAGRDFGKGLLAITFLLGLKLLLDVTPLKKENMQLGEWLRLSTYNLLQQRLTLAEKNEDIPVAVLDIKELRQQRDLNTPGRPLNRKNLRDIITALVAQKPLAVAVDVDFAPDYQDPQRTPDIGFLRFCKETSKSSGIPIFLGMDRNIDKPPQQWFEEEQFRDLAVCIRIPKSSEGVQKTYQWIGVENTGVQCISLPQALASRYPGSDAQLPAVLRWAIKWNDEKKEAGWVHSDVLVGYDPLHQLQEQYPRGNTLSAIFDQDISANGALFRNKLVLVGDADMYGSALHGIPAQQQPIPGVYIHACATYTLAKARLHELTLTGRLVLDALLSFLILGIIFGLRVWLRRFKKWELQTVRFERLLLWVLSIAAFVLVVYLVKATRLIWDDFFFVIAGLLLEPYIRRLFNWVKARLRNLFRHYIQQPTTGDQ